MAQIGEQLIFQAVLILLNAFFAATEIAVISLNATKLKTMVNDGDKAAVRLLKLVEEPSGFLSTIQVGITLAGFLGSALAADNFSGYFVDWVTDGLGITAIPVKVLDTAAVILITLIVAYFTLIFGELVPKRIAMQKPYEVAKIACKVISGVAAFMRPIVWFLSISTNGVLRLLHMKTEAEDDDITEEDIRMMISLGKTKGNIEKEEQEWIQNVFEFNDTKVYETMTRKSDMLSVAASDDAEEIFRLFEESGYSRIPVYDGDGDTILGILNAREFLLHYRHVDGWDWKEHIYPAYFVPETLIADKLFREMQKQKIHIAIVLDEYGEVSGMVTLEDLLEEIVGNIYDEFDEEEEPELQKIGENLWKAKATVSISDLEEALEMELEDNEEYDTLGGMIFDYLNAIPKDGAQLDLEIQGLKLQVKKIQQHKIEVVLISKIGRATAE